MNSENIQPTQNITNHNKCLQDELNNSFSNLEDDQPLGEEEKCEKVVIDIDEEESDEVLLKKESPVSFQTTVQEMSMQQQHPISMKKSPHSPTYRIKSKKDSEDIDEYLQRLKSLKQFQQFEGKYCQRIKVIYSLSILGSEPVSPVNLKRLKTFLFIPNYAQQLIRWGNTKFGTTHTVPSALERISYLQSSQCQHYTIKLKQHIRYIMALLFCLIIIKLMI